MKLMKNKSLIFSLILLFLCSMIFTLNNRTEDSQTIKGETKIKEIKISFIPNHDPITILGDSQFTSGNGVVRGNGSSINPYIIENLIIDGNNTSSSIYIFYTTVYFRIQNCTLYNSTESGSGGGIKLEQVENGEIYNNTITENNGYGISLIYTSSNNTIINNTIAKNKKFGIFNYYNSDDNQILSNKIFYNNYEGLGGYLSKNMTIQQNFFKDNRGGMYLENDCDNCTIYNNYFLVNLQECATDHGSYNIWHNGTSGNYWYDYGGIDSNEDGIGETPYQIFGDAFSEDPFPLVFPDDDGDGLDNLIEEFYYGTNKSKWDTDGDRYSDKIEIDSGTDPLNSTDFPNNAYSPQLIEGNINIDSGYEHTNFTFSVKYSDYDNKSPIYVQVSIDGLIYSMEKVNPSDNNYIDGCLYHFSVRLNTSNHQFYFRCYDGIFFNTTSLLSGPLVEKTLLIISPLNQTYITSNFDIILQNQNNDFIDVFYRIFSVSEDSWITPSNGSLFQDNFTMILENGLYFIEFFGNDTNNYYYQNQIFFTINVSIQQSSDPPLISGFSLVLSISFIIFCLVIIISFDIRKLSIKQQL